MNLLDFMQQTGKFKEFKFQLEEVDSTDVVGGDLIKIRYSTFFYEKERNRCYQISFRSSVICTRHFRLVSVNILGNDRKKDCHVRPDGASDKAGINFPLLLSLSLSNGIADIY